MSSADGIKIIRCTGYYDENSHECLKTMKEIIKLQSENINISCDKLFSLFKSFSYNCETILKKNIILIVKYIELNGDTNKFVDYQHTKISGSKFFSTNIVSEVLNRLKNLNIKNDNVLNYINNFFDCIEKSNDYNTYSYSNNTFINIFKIILDMYNNNLNIDHNKILNIIYYSCYNLLIDKNEGENFYNKFDGTLENKKKLKEILNIYYSSKNININYETFINAMVYDNYDDAIKFISSKNVKITNSSLNDFLNILINNKNIIISYKKTSDLQKCLTFFIENCNDYTNIDLNIIIEKTIKNFYSTRVDTLKSENIKIIINNLIDFGCKLNEESFILLIKSKIFINDPKKCGININNDKILAEFYSNSFNPYNLKFKYTLDLLRSECNKSGNLKKIKDICKTIEPDIICLENACKLRNNINTVKYLCDIKKLKPTINCIAYILINIGKTYDNYIVENYFKNKQDKGIKQQLENNNNELKIEIITEEEKPKKVIKKKLNKKEENNIVEVKTEEVKTEEVKTEEVKDVDEEDVKPKKKIIKKVIRKIVKKKKEDNTENISVENTENISVDNTENISVDNTENKKVIKRVIKKVVKKSEEKPKKIVKKKILSDEEKQNINIINLDVYEIPNNYNYRNKYKINKKLKDIIDEDEINHIDVRKKLLEYMNKNNILKKDIIISDINFKIENIDKFISAYVLEPNF